MGPMERCPYSKSGAHDLCTVVPDDDDRDMTLSCNKCGAIRRLPVSGALPSAPLDDSVAAFIERAALAARER